MLASADAGATASCVRDARQLTLRAKPERGDQADLDTALDAPIEMGTAIALKGSFAATAIRQDATGAVGLLALLADAGAGNGDRVIELGRLHGDVAVPRLASDGESVVVSIQEMTAGGQQVRVGRLAPSGEVTDWQNGPPQNADESSAYDVAVRGDSALLVWDEWRSAQNHGLVLAADLRWPEPAGEHGARARALSPAGVDAEAPRVVSRPGGYWVAWIVNAPRAPGRDVYDPDPPSGVSPALTTTLSYGPRWIEAAPLGERGELGSTPMRVTEPDARVVAFDLAPEPDGGARIAWQQGAPSPGAAGGEVGTVTLSASGPGETRWISEAAGAGMPTLLPAGGGEPPWISWPDDSDALRLTRLSPVASDPIVLPWPGAALLAARGDRLLLALPRPYGVELSLAGCGSRSAPTEARPP